MFIFVFVVLVQVFVFVVVKKYWNRTRQRSEKLHV